LQYFSEMIRNYLDLSRLEKGEFVVRTGCVHLSGDVVAPALGAMERELAQKKMMVANCISPAIEFEADRDLLRIVYDNLISNAIKYGKEGGCIQLDAGVEDGQVISSVWNEGRGIPPGKMSLLFNKFSRLDTPEYAGKKGTGLGLYICKEIVEKHRGRIWAESHEGEWTRFVFSLPRSQNREKE
jgi:signal transduction histidine kinase